MNCRLLINRRLLNFLIIPILVVLLLPVKGFCFSVTAQVDRNTISINDSVILSVVFEDGEGKVDTSIITDFSIASQSSSSSISIINGKYSRTVTAMYTLVPEKEGKLKIPPLSVESENQIYTTQEITIEVSGQAVISEDKASKDIFVEAGISSTALFTGQQAVYQLRLYSAVRYSNATLQPPSFKGFTAKEAGERKNYNEQINGRSYSVSELNYLIIPEVSGELKIDPALITCDVAVRRNSRDPFDDPFFSNGFFSLGRGERRRLSTEPVMVDVKPLPPYSGNTPFSGLVGNFSINAELDNHKLKTGESATLTISISGTGNLMDARNPHVVIPPEFKVYEDSPEEDIKLTLDGYTGKKIFKRALVPIEPGKYTIEPPVLSFFNVSTHLYETLSTTPVTVEVERSTEEQSGERRQLRADESVRSPDGLSSGQPGATGKMALKKRSVEFTGKDILSIKEDADILLNREELSLYLFLALFFLPCGIFFSFRTVMALFKREISVSAAMLKKARSCLKAAEESAKENIAADNCATQKKETLISQPEHSSHNFFKLLHDALIAMVMSKSGYAGKSITAYEATEILTAAGSPSEVADQVTALLDEIESARYGREKNDPAYRISLLKRAQKLFKTLAVVAFFISITSAPYSASIWADSLSEPFKSVVKTDSSGTIFLEGVKAYHSGNFKEAAQKFSALAQNGIRNPYLYYNIGNAYIKAGDAGHAILWYERAKKEIPLDPDLQFNLDYARGFVIDKSEGGGVDISELIFFWKDYFPPETVHYCAIIISFLFFFYAGIRLYRNRKIFTTAGVILFSALAVTGCTALYSYYQSYSNHFAVVLSKEASVRSGVSEDATQLFILHSGTKVKVEEIRGDYLKIFFPKDKRGWISIKDAEVI